MAEVSYSGYGKNEVRLMRVRKEGDKYLVTELKVNVELQLSTTKDFEKADNTDVVATDSQKNIIMALAKQNTIESPEQFGLLICRHFLTTYKQIIRCQVYMEQAPWQRIKQGGGVGHHHAFILEPSVIRFCCISEMKGGVPSVYGGLKDMKLFKATQSGFEGFVRDKYTSLPETKDRAVCTNVYLKYEFKNDIYGVNFNGVWQSVKDSVLEVFAGHPYTGTYSPSVQYTMFNISKLIFSKVLVVNSVQMNMPNIHYFVADLSKINIPNTGELLLPSDAPQGMISATFKRETDSKL